MYNQDIYNKLEEKFEPFNMPLICEGIAEMYKIMATDRSNPVYMAIVKEFEYEWIWWSSAIERANNSINK